MKVILTQELKGKGGEGDVVDVARGYAVNYLFPRKIAIEATPGNLKQLEARQGNIQKREEARLAEASGLAGALNGKSVTIEAKVGEGGRLYGSITSMMVMDAIADQLAADVDRRKIDVHGVIKTLGDHVVSVQVYRDVKAEVTVHVVPEGGEGAVEEAAAAQESVSSAETADAEDGSEASDVSAEEDVDVTPEDDEAIEDDETTEDDEATSIEE